MKLKGLTFILTEDCNWRCSYCYQPRGKARISKATLTGACDILFSSLSDSCLVGFTGGEPLLFPGLIRHAVDELGKKNRHSLKHIRYLLTTNGSLLTQQVVEFLEEHRFEVMLSFDGPAQEEERQPGSLGQIKGTLDRLLRGTTLRLGTNSVFTPRTAGRLFESLRDLVERGVSEVSFALCVQSSWDGRARRLVEDELETLRAWLLEFYEKHQTIPVLPFRPRKTSGIFFCPAGRDRLALAADGSLWGCHLFADFFQNRRDLPQFQNYCFGRLENGLALTGRPFRRIQGYYARLTMENMRAGSSPCLACGHLEECSVCPAAAAFSSRAVGLISRDACWSSRLAIRQRRLFEQEVKKLMLG